jgi:hypothetical protein
MTKTQTALLTATIIGFLVWLFTRKKANAATSANPFLVDIDWSADAVKVHQKQLGKFTILPSAWKNAQQGKFHTLKTNGKFDLSWLKALPDEVVIVLTHKTGAKHAEAYVINFTNQEAQFHSKFNEVTITA